VSGAPRHWREALIEAAGLGLFMISAGLFGTLLEAPGAPLRAAIDDPFLRRALMGVAMGATAIALIYSPWGRRSGAHFNPATTLTFFRLGKVERADALLYPAAQLAGGVLGVLLVAGALGPAFTAKPVDWVATRPGATSLAAAFGAEAAMTALLMTVVLHVSNRERIRRYTGLCAGALVALFITFEAPLSGMSLNPARTLASAIPSGDLSALWIYLLAPPLGMLAAAELYLRFAGPVRCAKLDHDDSTPCPFRCGWCRHEAPGPEPT
jgi:aquaporin Z